MTHRTDCQEQIRCRCFCKKCYADNTCVCRKCLWNKDEQVLIAFDHWDPARGKSVYPPGPWPRSSHPRYGRDWEPTLIAFPEVFCRRCSRMLPSELEMDDLAGKVRTKVVRHTRHEGQHVVRCPGSGTWAEPSPTPVELAKVANGDRDLELDHYGPRPELPAVTIHPMAAAMAWAMLSAELGEEGGEPPIGPVNSDAYDQETIQEGCD